ncbi:phage tail protein [Dickeya lacustris]|uniref:Phage tail protein n=1 Tax=Dickeya lacustris TaxID=2259638 RepID=A0ABY8G4U2_9GAMM|nr:phage tail protein [Dickeya lacustris]WFN54939.1 phage tail protein [Dickeya lacustris]
MQKTSAQPEWPLAAFYFRVSIDNGSDDQAFEEISGIETHLETQPFIEGGGNSVYHLPVGIRQQPLRLRRGLTAANSLLVRWCKSCLEGQLNQAIVTKDLSVSLLNEQGDPLRTWLFYNAYPISWQVGRFHASRNEVAVEEIVLCFSRSKRKQ